jgi:hypothetical protein
MNIRRDIIMEYIRMKDFEKHDYKNFWLLRYGSIMKTLRGIWYILLA